MTKLSAKKLALSLILIFCICLMTSCGKNQSEQILESLQAVETAMRQNVDNPEALFAELDKCIEQYTPVWEKSAHLLETTAKDSFQREMNLQIVKLRAVSQEIIDLDLEIQDRIQNQPELIKAYRDRIQRIGIR